ncbi:hypothetical protein ACSBR2_021948 [Camellia fascicularis]
MIAVGTSHFMLKSSSTAVYEYFSEKLSEMKYGDLLEISSADLIGKGISYISTRQDAVKKLLDKVFKVRLGRGFYGECLGVRADGNSNLSDEIGKELSIKSAAAGLRPIGAIGYMQRNNLKMCLRSTDTATDTSEVAKVCKMEKHVFVFLLLVLSTSLKIGCFGISFNRVCIACFKHKGIWWRRFPKFQLLYNKDG